MRMNTDGATHLVRQLDAGSFDGCIRSGIVLVDFGERYCGPCQMQSAVLERLATRIGSQVTLAEVDVDMAPDVAARFHVESIPTLLLFKDGQLRRQFVGVQREARLAKVIHEVATE